MAPSPESPDFSPLAERYARSRPRYPDDWFAWLATQVERRELAWDAATGNGQAALGLVPHFARIVATDVSAAQIRHAIAHPTIDYRVAPSEASGLEPRSVDLVTVGAAVHWFDLDAFDGEVRRVVRPRGLLAVFTYHVGIVRPPFDRVFATLYFDVLRPFFADRVHYVDDRYTTLPLPGEPLPVPSFRVTASWSFAELVDFVHSWSATAVYRERQGHDPLDTVAAELTALWGDPGTVRTLEWPLFARVSRL